MKVWILKTLIWSNSKSLYWLEKSFGHCWPAFFSCDCRTVSFFWRPIAFCRLGRSWCMWVMCGFCLSTDRWFYQKPINTGQINCPLYSQFDLFIDDKNHTPYCIVFYFVLLFLFVDLCIGFHGTVISFRLCLYWISFS